MIRIKKYKIAQISVLIILISIISFTTQIITVKATPTPPVTLVNHDLRQCAEHVLLGDECYYCTPTAGWEILGFEQECPSNYTNTDKPILSCTVHTPPPTPYSECAGANITVSLLTPFSVRPVSTLAETTQQEKSTSLIKSDTLLYTGLAAFLVMIGIKLATLISKKDS